MESGGFYLLLYLPHVISVFACYIAIFVIRLPLKFGAVGIISATLIQGVTYFGLVFLQQSIGLDLGKTFDDVLKTVFTPYLYVVCAALMAIGFGISLYSSRSK